MAISPVSQFGVRNEWIVWTVPCFHSSDSTLTALDTAGRMLS